MEYFLLEHPIFLQQIHDLFYSLLHHVEAYGLMYQPLLLFHMLRADQLMRMDYFLELKFYLLINEYYTLNY